MKKKLLKMGSYFYFFSCAAVMLTNIAYAYIDPSTTTYIIQAIAGVLIAVGASFTVFRHKITAAWRKWYYGRLAKKNERERAAEKKDAE